MKKIVLLTLIISISGSQLLAESGVAFNNDKIKKEIKEKIKIAKEKGSRFNIVGSVSAYNSSYLMVNGERLKQLNTTQIIGKVGVGSNVKVKGFIQNGEKLLTHIIVNNKINNASKLKDKEDLIFDGSINGVSPETPLAKLGS